MGNPEGQQQDRSRLHLLKGIEIGRAEVIKDRIANHKGMLSLNERHRLAVNLGVLLEKAKGKGCRMDDIVAKAVPRISHSSVKPGNELSNYRIVPGGRDGTRARKLCARPGKYLALAQSAAREMGMDEHEAIIVLAEGTVLFDKPVLDDAGLEPAVRVLELLKAHLEEISLGRGLESYLRDATALHALPKWGADGPIDGWEVDHAHFEFHETDAWPRVLLAAVVRGRAPASIRKDGRWFEGEAIYAEQVYLALGWDEKLGVVRPFLDIVASSAARPTGVDGMLNLDLDSPWITSGYPPATGHFRVSKTVIVAISTGHRLANGLASDEDWRTSESDPYGWSRLVRLDAAAMVEYLVELDEFHRLDSNLPFDVDASTLVSPPSTILAKVEAALLQRYRDGESYKSGDCPDFIAKLDGKAAALVESFREWRSQGGETAITDHRRAIAEVRERLDRLRGAQAAGLPGKGVEAPGASRDGTAGHLP